MKLTSYQLSLPDTETWEMNSYYAVAFEDRWYPGVVTEIKGDDWALIKYAPLWCKFQMARER